MFSVVPDFCFVRSHPTLSALRDTTPPRVILDALIRGGRLSMDRYRARTLIGGVVLILL